MENKYHKQSLFESGFDSFEFDDGFLMRLDSDLKKNKSNGKQHDGKCNRRVAEKENCIQEKKEKKIEYYDLPLFIEDLNESDFFDLSQKKNKKKSSKVANGHTNEKSRKASLTNSFVSCLSPILGSKSTIHNLSSSTPVKPNTESNAKEKQAQQDKPAKPVDYAYLEADLFDDWDANEVKTEHTPKSTVTLSQALKLIDKAESERVSNEKKSLNQSIDLLTGEVVCADMFDEPFDVPESLGKKEENADCSSDSVVIVEEFKPVCKPAAAHKLNFQSDKVNNLAGDKENIFGTFSDDDFDFFTQDLLDGPKEPTKPNSHVSVAKSPKPLQESDVNDSTDAVIPVRRKRGKCFAVIESDTTEDSPSPKFRRQSKTNKHRLIKTNRQRNKSQENAGKEFIESEAEVSDEVEVSSDEAEEDGEYDRSFLDEESYFTQNCSANMTSKYLESVKGVTVPGGFKIPAARPYSPINVFSQIPEENDADYEIDSFCVNDVEEEIKTDLSDLEVAEKILEMDRRKRKRKRSQKLRK